MNQQGAAVDPSVFDGPVWKGPPAEYHPNKIFHPPTEEQKTKGWEQNWDAYKANHDSGNTAGGNVQVNKTGNLHHTICFCVLAAVGYS